MIEIPDASVAVKWFVRSGELGLEAADEVRRRVLLQPDGFAVPSLFVYEVEAALCRRARGAADVKGHLRALWALGLRVVEPDQTLGALAADLAFAYRLTGYDAAYLALARHLGGAWLTFDGAAYRRVARMGAARLLG